MPEYVHGYATPEQQRLVRQAEHWRHDLGRRNDARAGTRLLEIGCGVGAVMAVPFDDQSFDHVWMMWFLEHLAEPVAALHEARVLTRRSRVRGLSSALEQRRSVG